MAKQKSSKPSPSQTPNVRAVEKKTVVKERNKVSEPSVLDYWLPIAAILLVTFCAFMPTFQNDFVNWDDNASIYDNKNLNGFTWQNIRNIFQSNVLGGYYPFTTLSLAIEKALFSKEILATVIHTNNLILHLVVVFLVYRLVSLMGFSRWSALVVALLFGIHPMRVESVAWATERKDVLFGTFYFAALVQYAKYLKSESYGLNNRHFFWAFVLFVCALFSKVQAVSLPFSLLAIDYYFKRPLTIKRIFEKAPFFLGSLVMGVVAIGILKNKGVINASTNDYSFFERITIGLNAYVVYLGKCIYPWVMSPIYSLPTEITGTFYAATLFFILSAVGIWYAYSKGWSTLVFGWVFFIVNYIFVSQIVQAGQGYLADRYVYVPYFGFFIITAAFTEGVLFKDTRTVQKLEEKKIGDNVDWKMKLGVAIYAIVLFFTTYNQVKVWKNSESLWTHAINCDDKVPVAYKNRALDYLERKEYDKALNDINTSLGISPIADTYNARSKIYVDMNKPTEAIADCNSTLLLDSTFINAWANRGVAYGQLRQLDSALFNLSKALELDSLHLVALGNRGAILNLMGKKEEAIRDLSKVIELDPTEIKAVLNRALTYRSMGQNDHALIDFDQYLAIKKDNAPVWADRGVLKRQLNRCVEAVLDFDEAIKINSFNGLFYIERAQCHRILGNRSLMQADVQTAKARGVQNIDPLLLQ